MLTDLRCRAAKGADRPYKLADAHSLFLFVTRNGYRSWRFKYQMGGKQKQLIFGAYPEISLAQARELRDEARRLIRAGRDPSLEKRQLKARQIAESENVFALHAEAWLKRQEPLWSPVYSSNVRGQFDNDILPKLGSIPIRSITTPMVVDALKPILDRGAIEAARRARQRISEVHRYAIAIGAADNDPAGVVVSAMPHTQRGRFPAVRSAEDARTVLAKVEAMPSHPLVKLASRMIALTAARSAMVRLAKPEQFEDLDGDAPMWRVPAQIMKSRRTMKVDPSNDLLVPLSRQAVAVVKTALTISRGGMVFCSVYDPRLPISDSTISAMYLDAGLRGIHVPHGWRSAFSTIMNERAMLEERPGDRAVIDLMLAHVVKGTEGVYNRAAYMRRRREIAQEWADLIMADLPGPEQLLDGMRRQHWRGAGHERAGRKTGSDGI